MNIVWTKVSLWSQNQLELCSHKGWKWIFNYLLCRFPLVCLIMTVIRSNKSLATWDYLKPVGIWNKFGNYMSCFPMWRHASKGFPREKARCCRLFGVVIFLFRVTGLIRCLKKTALPLQNAGECIQTHIVANFVLVEPQCLRNCSPIVLNIWFLTVIFAPWQGAAKPFVKIFSVHAFASIQCISGFNCFRWVGLYSQHVCFVCGGYRPTSDNQRMSSSSSNGPLILRI